MNEYIEVYLELVKDDKSEGTYAVRKSCLKQFDEWIETEGYDLGEISALELRKYFKKLLDEGCSSTYVVSHYNSVRGLYNLLTSNSIGLREDHPFDEKLLKSLHNKHNKRTKKREDGKPIYLSEDDVDILCRYVPKPKLRNRLLFRLMLHTGVRQSEAARIKLENMNREKRSIEIPTRKIEGEPIRVVSWQPSLDLLMDRWIDVERNAYNHASESPYLFVSARSDRIIDEYPNDILRKAAKSAEEDGHEYLNEVLYHDAAGMPRYRYTAHSLRHGCAYHLLKAGTHLRTIQKYLGHTDVERTEVYLQLTDDDVLDTVKWG
ncbi:tyrosine-type recombinase/integrase [Halomarina pelagica]|uniref:tyrosine-type recombinase/integrase n=1 Tax=Halomarina pelagica TaxID=2961599 RepID=UPI0020C4C18E|nr:tyrosine-type recombinase/integrase [Halomarina sp. BND7]